jgi:hypothetical protein
MIVEDGMTQEQAEQIAKPAPKGKYEVEITGFFVGPDGSPVIENETSGNRMLRLKLKVASGPYKDGINQDETLKANEGKLIKAYNAVYGTGFMAAFKRAFPDCLTETGAVNTDLAVGQRAFAELKVTTYEGVESNEISKLYPKNA